MICGLHVKSVTSKQVKKVIWKHTYKLTTKEWYITDVTIVVIKHLKSKTLKNTCRNMYLKMGKINWNIIALHVITKQSVANIFEYSNILGTNIYSDIRSYQFFFYKYIRTFVRVKFVCTNIFGHSLVSVKPRRIFEYIRIFVQFSIRILIRTFVRVKKIIMNIFGYSFV